MVSGLFVLSYLASFMKVHIDYYHVAQEEHSLFVLVFLEHFEPFSLLCSLRVTSVGGFCISSLSELMDLEFFLALIIFVNFANDLTICAFIALPRMSSAWSLLQWPTPSLYGLLFF